MNTQRKLVLTSIFAVATVMAIARCGVTPIFLNASPSVVMAGSSTTFTVGVSSTAPTGGQVVTITPDDPANFSSIPSTVTVLAGQTSAQFQATTSEDSAEDVTVTVSCNGGSRDREITVIHQR